MMLWRWIYWIWVTSIFVFLPAPIVIVVISSFSRSGYLQFPPRELSLRWYEAFLTSADWMETIAVSVVLALAVAAFTTLVCLLAAFARQRVLGRSGRAFDSLMQLPLFMPHVAMAIALLGMLSAMRWVATYPGIALAHVVVCLPFAYRPLLTSLKKMDLAVEEAAMSLGATPGYTLWHVTLPMLRPGITASFVFSFIISFDEVGVTMFLTGPHVTTLPVRIFTEIQESGTPVIAAVSSFLVGVTVILFLLVDRIVGMDLLVESEHTR
jgi:putative spermidine/putrescine transport system permease protein